LYYVTVQLHCYNAFVPRVVDHEERRREIAHAVWHLIATRGIEAVTQRAVAAEAGISVGRIQHYFSSKVEMVRYGCRALIGASADAFRGRTSDAGPVEALRDLVTHNIPRTDALRIGTTVWYAYLAKSVDDPEIAATLREAKRGEEEEAARLLGAAQHMGHVRKDLDAGVVARRLLSTADGLAARVLIGQLAVSEAVGALEEDLRSLLERPLVSRDGGDSSDTS
jgi:TetR/AcrR family transcriptional regulator, transcriptional repressor of bet genes